ncbi:methionine ABC transporter permease [Actinomyces minihominis]|uniref:methionine ABC transporter permease n=1 Tax=Actinomyces minihominis TaxID=2002838 RepID=UPI00352259B5
MTVTGSALLFEASLKLSVLVAAPGDPRWGDNPTIQQKFWPAVLETLMMVGSASALTVLFGLPLGLLLASSSRGGLKPRAALNQVVGVIVNIVRSFPFMILLIALLPLTRLIMGSAVGWKAAVVPLVVGAVPFFARLVETNVAAINPGTIEAAQMMGASNLRIQWGVQVREALPSLVQSVTVLFITLIGYSAMAGAIGAGGLGALAMNYGYNQWQDDVMILTVIAIVIIVQAVQMLGDMISRLVDHR